MTERIAFVDGSDNSRSASMKWVLGRSLFNISNLTTRLLRLGMIFIPKGAKTIYRSKDEFTGQQTLF